MAAKKSWKAVFAYRTQKIRSTSKRRSNVIAKIHSKIPCGQEMFLAETGLPKTTSGTLMSASKTTCLKKATFMFVNKALLIYN